MKSKTIYQCEHCSYESEDKQAVYEHDLKHLGLTDDEYRTWNNLKANAKQAGCRVFYTKNEETDKQFDEAVQRLADFEKEHNLN